MHISYSQCSDLDYSSRPEITSKAEAVQLMWDRLFPHQLNLLNTLTTDWNVTTNTTTFEIKPSGFLLRLAAGTVSTATAMYKSKIFITPTSKLILFGSVSAGSPCSSYIDISDDGISWINILTINGNQTAISKEIGLGNYAYTGLFIRVRVINDRNYGCALGASTFKIE